MTYLCQNKPAQRFMEAWSRKMINPIGGWSEVTIIG